MRPKGGASRSSGRTELLVTMLPSNTVASVSNVAVIVLEMGLEGGG